MPQNRGFNSEQSKLKRWRAKLPYFLGAIVFHLILFVLLATWVIFDAPRNPPDAATFGEAKIAAPPPPPPPPPPSTSGGGSQNPLAPDVTVTPPEATSAVTTVNTASSFHIAASPIPQAAPTDMGPARGSDVAPSPGTGGGLDGGMKMPAMDSLLGSTSPSGGLSGYFYDLKQSPDHTPIWMSTEKEQNLLRDFLKTWNEEDLGRQFLKSSTKLYANEILVPILPSEIGPSAFNMGDICQPGFWTAIYHLKVKAARTGDFHVAGYGDDFLVVRVDGKIVLDSGYTPPVTDFQRQTIYTAHWDRHLPIPSYGQTVVGDIFHMERGQDITIDILIGDAGAFKKKGLCAYFLFLLEDGKTYDTNSKGDPVLPLLQIHPNPDVHRDGDLYPPFTANPEDALMGL